MNAALHYTVEAFDTSGPKLMGRHAAGEGFLRGYARHYRTGRNVAGDHCTCTHESVGSDRYSRQHDGSRADERFLPNADAAGQHAARRNVRAIADATVVLDNRCAVDDDGRSYGGRGVHDRAREHHGAGVQSRRLAHRCRRVDERRHQRATGAPAGAQPCLIVAQAERDDRRAARQWCALV